jgi:hypothetical protein
MLENYQQNFLPPGTMLVNPDGSLTNAGRFLLQALWNRTGQGTGVPIEVDSAVVAAGTTQADATPLNLDWNEVLTVPANSGVVLLPMQDGQSQLVFNGGANGLKVYPSDALEIDALGVNAPYVLAAGKTQVFRQVTTTLLRSIQWG